MNLKEKSIEKFNGNRLMTESKGQHRRVYPKGKEEVETSCMQCLVFLLFFSDEARVQIKCRTKRNREEGYLIFCAV